MNYFNEFTGVTRRRLVDYPGLSNLRIYIKHEWPRLSRENSHEPLIPRSRITRLNEAGRLCSIENSRRRAISCRRLTALVRKPLIRPGVNKRTRLDFSLPVIPRRCFNGRITTRRKNFPETFAGEISSPLVNRSG